MAKLNEEKDKPRYVRRPNGGAEPCVSGTTGRYEIPSSTPKGTSYFSKMRADVGGNGAEPRSDAPLRATRRKS